MYVLEYRNRSTNIYRPVFFGLYAFILFDMFESSVGVQSSVRSARAARWTGVELQPHVDKDEAL